MSRFAGTVRVARLAARRDRVKLPVWLAALTLVHAFSAASTIALYDTAAERLDLARGTTKSAVAVMFNGLVSGTSEGAIAMSQSLLVVMVGAALMSFQGIVRHTRQNEATGRFELLGSTSVGRLAPLVAAVLVVAGANVVLGGLNAAALVACGLPVGGSVAAGATITAVGVAFAAVGAVTAQVASTSRAANGLAGAVLATAFALRAVGDISGSVVDGGVRVVSGWPSWLSPLGWGQQVRPFDEHTWEPLALLAVFAVGTLGVAFVLIGHRDLGSGMLPARPGPPRARPALLSPVGLAWRLQRSLLLGWAVALMLMGVSLGAIAPEVEDFLGDSSGTRDLLEGFGGQGTLVQVYLAASMAMVGLGVAAYVVQATLRVRNEEETNTLEAVLATAVSRRRWVLSHAVVVVAGTAALLALCGASAGVAYGATAGGPVAEGARLGGAGLGQLPAVLVLGGFTLLLFGVLPRWCVAGAWAGFATCLLLGQIGDLLGLPQLLLGLSPFSHLPALPVERFDPVPVLALLVVGAALATGGLVAFDRRDITT